MQSEIVLGRVSFGALFLCLILGVPACSRDESTSATEVSVPEPSAIVASEEDAAEPAVADKQRRAIEPPKSVETQADWRATFAGLDLDAAFAAIAQGIRYEPYRGVLRGGEGALNARSGNSLDQSLLLADVLRYLGYRVRFARGRLDGDNLDTLLRGLFPPNASASNLGEEFAPYDPSADTSLESARDHFWVEVFQPDAWLPLDPSFPRAVVGEAYSKASDHFDDLPAEAYQQLRITVWQELADGSKVELGSHEDTVQVLAMQPMALVAHRVPKAEAADGKKPKGTAGTFGGLGGGLAGGAQKDEPEEEATVELVAVEHQWQLYVGDTTLPLKNTLVAEQERDGFIRHEWLEFEISQPGSAPVVVRRTLYWYEPGGAAEPSSVRHYVVTIVPGPITEEQLQAERARIGAGLDLEEWQRELRKAANIDPDSQTATTRAGTLREQGARAAAGGGYLVGLAHAAASDRMSREVAYSNGVAIIWPQPRILITSIETDELDDGGTDSRVTLDLRLDRVQAVPYPGFPQRTASLFQTARGMQNTVLEGAVLSEATGLKMPVTTAVVMVKAADDGTPLQTLVPGNSEPLQNIEGLPAQASELIAKALKGGYDIIIPERAARLGSRDRWGWWQVDRDTGEVIGVMDDGQHQATTNYSFSLSKVGLDDRTGLVIGGIIGANSTLFTISALMLKYGETSPQMIAEVEKYVKSIMCRSCPSKAGVSAGASGGISAGNDCFKLEKKVSASIGASASISFCEKYQEGFACASGMLLQGLTGGGGAKASIGGEVGVSVQVNCEKAFGGLQVDDSGYSVNGKNQVRN